MHFVWRLLACVLCDNIEIDIADFSTLHCIDKVIYSEDIRYANSVKISHLGDIRLDFLKVEPRVLLIYDRTKYFSLKRPIVYRIDFEYKILGLASFVWPLIGFCIVYSCLAIALVQSVFRYLDMRIEERPKAGGAGMPEDRIFVDTLYNKADVCYLSCALGPEFSAKFCAPPMEGRKIELSDLVNLGDGTSIDIAAVTDVQDQAYDLVREEIESFVERPRKRARALAADFYSSVPATELKSSIDGILKTRSIQEERLKRHMQFDFDRKMQRINRIKSKTYRRLQRRDRIRKEQELQVSDDEAPERSGSSECSPVLEFKHDDTEESEPEQASAQHEMVRQAFEDPEVGGNEKDFLEEKAAVVEGDAPKVIETVLPGWDDWAGEGIELKKTRHNTFTERKEGIRNCSRRDFNRSRVIINEHVEVPDKYKSELPYGYGAKDYAQKIRMPVSAETNSLRVFKRLIGMNRKDEEMPGRSIKPAEFEPEY